MPRHDDIPRPPIAAVLAELTGVDEKSVPTGFGWTRLRCPFHEDRTPSASVNHDPETGGFRCHSCGRHGDGLKLLQQELGLSFSEACDKARALGGDSQPGQKTKRRTRRASDLL